MSSGRHAFVFLDRDGTLNVDHGFTHEVEAYELIPGVVEGLRAMAEAGFALAVVTNQSGIALGRFTSAQLDVFHRHLARDLARHGIELRAVLHCPHLRDAGCDCRKPQPGLLRQAESELGADLSRSWVVGDRGSDVELAARSGCRGAVLVLTGHGADESRALGAAVPRARDLVEAARIVAEGSAQGAP